MKLLVFATHPIQYQAPWFRSLAASRELDLTVAFGLIPSAQEQSIGFGVPFEWDLPLLDGYRSVQLELAPGAPSIASFRGLRARNLGALIVRERPDVVLVTGWNSWILLQATRSSRALGIPVVVRGESNDLRSRPFAVRLLQRLLLRRFRASLAIGKANRRFLVARGVEPESIFDTPYFVDNGRFAEAARALEPEREALRQSWSIPRGAIAVLFAGKLIPKKRPLDLVRALASCAGSDPELHLLIAGEGELRREVEEACRELRVRASFAGFLNQTEIPRAYAAADVLALPSDAGETWGLVVNEAMASGRAAIVSDRVGCAEDLIDEGVTGWTHGGGRVEELAAVARRAASRREQLCGMGAEAQRKVLAEYSVERAVAGTIEACRFAMESRSA